MERNKHQEILDAIVRARDEGCITPKEVADRLGMNPVIIQVYDERFSLGLNKRQVKSPEPEKFKTKLNAQYAEFLRCELGRKALFEDVAELLEIDKRILRAECKHHKIEIPSRKEQVANSIIYELREGAKNLREVSEKTGLGYGTITQVAKEKDIIPRDSQGYKDDWMLDFIRCELGRYGRMTDIAELLGTTKKNLVQVCFRHRMVIPSRTKRVANSLRYALMEGERRLEALEEIAGHMRALKVCKREKIPVPEDLIPNPTNPTIDDRLDDGLSFAQIGRLVGLTGQGVWDYLFLSGQLQIAEQKQEQRKQYRTEQRESLKIKDDHRKQLLSVLNRYIVLQHTDGWALKRAVQRQESMSAAHLQYSLREVADMAAEYRAKEGKHGAISDIARKFGTRAGTVAKILKEAGVREYKKIERIPDDKEEVIRKAYESGISAADASYFIKASCAGIQQRWTSMGKGRKRSFLFYTSQREKLTYAKASQIYEAKDLGFDDKEITQLLDYPEALVSMTLRRRDEIEPRVIRVLRVLFPDEDIQKGYR